MIGRRCPNKSIPPPLQWSARLIGWLFIAVALCHAQSVRAAPPAHANLRVRIEWGGHSQLWECVVEARAGMVADPQPLGVEADEVGSMWIEDGALRAKSRSSRSYDGVDLLVKAPLDSSLSIRVWRQGEPPPTFAHEVKLRTLLTESVGFALGDDGGRVVVRRSPGDALRVKLMHDSAVFSPGDPVELELEPYLPDVPADTRLEMEAVLTPARGDRELWKDGATRSMPADAYSLGKIPLSVPLPEQEGVYDLTLKIYRQGIPARLGWRHALAERKVQVVVVGDTPPDRSQATEDGFTVLTEIDAANPGWWGRSRLSQAGALLPGLRKAAIGSGDVAPWRHSTGMLMQLGTGGVEPNTSWEAYPMAVGRPGQPHILEVEYPADVPQSLGISIVEPNAAGGVTPIGLDSGVYLPDEAAASGEARLARHRVVFWPRTKAPLVLLTNRRDGTHAVYGKIRLWGPPAPSTLSISKPPSFHLSPALTADTASGGRLLAASYDRPLFPENFSASEHFDPYGRRGLDDWVTFYEGATRLVEYLRHTGQNALVMSVLADGSTIYPSELLSPTPRYDMGVFLSSASDPVRKDVLELLFRLCDREGITLVPALQFSAPLPKLEQFKRENPGSGVELVDAAGVAWTRDHRPRQGLAAYYNPLAPEVQFAIREVVDELCERYGDHPSFGGLAIQLSPDGYMQFPGPEWGADLATLRRFSAAANVALPDGAGPADIAERAALISGRLRAEWLRWRSDELADFHRSLAVAVRSKSSKARLYMLASRVFDRPEFENSLRPTLDPSSSHATLLAHVGLDATARLRDDALVWLRPYRFAPAASVLDEAANAEFNASPALDEAYFHSSIAGATFFHEPQETRLASFDSESPFQPSQMWIVAQPSPSESRARRRFTHALAKADTRVLVDGGWLLPMGQEDAVRELMQIYRRLPDAPFQTVGSKAQPVVARTYADSSGVYVYLVNDSPWNATTTLSLRVDAGCRIRSLGAKEELLTTTPGQPYESLSIQLAPYSLAAFHAQGGLEVVDYSVQLDAGAALALDARIRDLGARVVALQQPRTFESIANAGFEEPPTAGERLPGWTIEGPASGVTVTTEGAQSGERCVRLASSGEDVSIVTNELRSPRLGKIVIAARVRIADPQRQPQLRMSLEGKLPGGTYFRYALLGTGGTTTRQQMPLTTEWKKYVFEVDQVPTATLTNARVRFTLVGEGEAWIDEVEIYEPALEREELNTLRKMLTVANYKLQEGQLVECLRLLDSYWPRYLESQIPLTQGPIVELPAPQTAKPETPKPGFLGRMRSALPSFWR